MAESAAQQCSIKAVFDGLNKTTMCTLSIETWVVVPVNRIYLFVHSLTKGKHFEITKKSKVHFNKSLKNDTVCHFVDLDLS